jgi:hypothetical protein
LNGHLLEVVPCDQDEPNGRAVDREKDRKKQDRYLYARRVRPEVLSQPLHKFYEKISLSGKGLQLGGREDQWCQHPCAGMPESCRDRKFAVPALAVL